MTGPEHWYCGRAPHTDMERRQAETEAAYAREEEAERRARFDEHPPNGVNTKSEKFKVNAGDDNQTRSRVY